jgi:tetratricopeptide (TPR) repeat protein
VLLYEQGRFAEAVALAMRELAAEPDPTGRAHLAAIIGEAWLDLGHRQRAATLLMEAQATLPDSARVQEALATIGYDENWRREVSRLTLRTSEVSQEEAARLCLRAARILRMEAPADPQYEAMLRLVLEFDPRDSSANDMLEALLLDGRRWDELASHHVERVRAVEEPQERAARCLRYAFLWSERLRNPARAEMWLRQAIATGEVPQPVAALALLRDLVSERGDFAVLLDAVDRVLAGPHSAESEVFAALLGGATAWKRLGELARARSYFARARPAAAGSWLLTEFDEALSTVQPEAIGEEQRALMEAAHRATLNDSPEQAIELWKRAVAADPTRRAPRRTLARLYGVLERWRALVDALKEEEAQACASVDERVEVLLEMAAVYRDHLKHDVQLTATLERASELDPDNLPVLDHLAEQYESQRRWPELVAALTRKAQRVPHAAERFELYLHLAQLFLKRLHNEPEAVRALEAASSLRPDDARAAAPLEELYEKRREWAELVAFRRRALERVADPAQRLGPAVELARLATDKLKRLDAAAPAWEAVLAIDPRHEEALAQLEQLFTRHREWQQLAAVYERQIANAPDAAGKAAWLQKLALLCTNSLEDTPRAIAAWRALLEAAPGNPRAQDALKKLYVAGKAWSELELFYASQGNFEEYVRLLERQIELEDEATRVELWERMALMYRDVLGKPDRALRAFEKVLALHPAQRGAAEALIPMYQEARDQRKLAGVLAVQLQHTTDASLRQVRLRRLAELWDGLHELPTAYRAWLDAFAEDSRSESVRAECERLAQLIGEWAPLVEAYGRACATIDSPAAALPLLLVMARAQDEHQGDATGARASLLRVLELDERNAHAMQALERLYLQQGQHADLQQLYERQLGLGGDASARRAVRFKLARLAERSGDEPQAIAAFHAILDEAPPEKEAHEALDALEQIHQRRGEYALLARVLEAQLARDGERAAVRFRLAELRELHLDDVAGAVELYRQLLDADPTHAGACAALERRLADPAHRLIAATLLDPIWQRAGEWQKLIRVREVMVEHAADAARQVELLHSIAALQLERLAQPEAAFEALGRALKADPSHAPTPEALEQLGDRLRAWSSLAQLYREVVQRPLALAQQVDLRCRLGRIYLERLDEPERAEATFSRVLDLDGGNRQAAAALAELRARR